MSAFQRGGVANAQHRTKSRFHSDFWPCICTGCHCVYVPSTEHHSCFGAWQNYLPIKFNYITIYIICSLWCSDKKGCVLIWIYPFNFSTYLMEIWCIYFATVNHIIVLECSLRICFVKGHLCVLQFNFYLNIYLIV